MGFGTDQGATPLLHGRNADEFVYRKEFRDMDEVDILKQATINSAVLARRDTDYGTIKVGKIAGLVAVDGDPLKNISVVRDRLTTVVKSGAVVKNM